MKKLRAKLALVCLMLTLTVGIASLTPVYAGGPQGGTDSSQPAPAPPPDLMDEIMRAILMVIGL